MSQPASSGPTPPPSAALSARVAEVRDQLADAVAAAGLRGDPYRGVLEAFGACLAVMGEVAERMGETRSPLSPESTRLLISQTARQAAMAMAGKVDPLMSALKWRAWAKIAVVVSAIAIVCVGCGFYLAHAFDPPWALRCQVLNDGNRWCQINGG